MHISRDMEKSLTFSSFQCQIDQVEKDMKNASAGKRQVDLVDTNVVVWLHGFCCQSVKYFLNAEKTSVRFAVYKIDSNCKWLTPELLPQ